MKSSTLSKIPSLRAHGSAQVHLSIHWPGRVGRTHCQPSMSAVVDLLFPQLCSQASNGHTDPAMMLFRTWHEHGDQRLEHIDGMSVVVGL
jgi:hypothetical protein